MKVLSNGFLALAFVVNVWGYHVSGNKWCVLIATAVAVYGIGRWRHAK